jgi:hypothetical protein
VRGNYGLKKANEHSGYIAKRRFSLGAAQMLQRPVTSYIQELTEHMHEFESCTSNKKCARSPKSS